MKISQFSVTPYSIPFVRSLQTSRNTYSHRKGAWLNLKWENFSGWGEAAPLIGFSADVTSSRIFLGYYWGVFIPIGEYHRFFIFGAGLGVYNIDLSFKLNLCSQFISTGTEGVTCPLKVVQVEC